MKNVLELPSSQRYITPPLTDIPQYSFYENSAIPQFRNWFSTIYNFSQFRFVFSHNLHDAISTIYKTVFPQFTRQFSHNLQEYFSTIYKISTIQQIDFPQFTNFPQSSEYIFHNLQHFHNLAGTFSTMYKIPQFRGHIFHNIADAFSTIYKTKFVPIEFPQFIF